MYLSVDLVELGVVFLVLQYSELKPQDPLRLKDELSVTLLESCETDIGRTVVNLLQYGKTNLGRPENKCST